MNQEEDQQPNKTALPEASPEMNEHLNEHEQSKAPPSRRKMLYLLGGIAFLVIVALCIALPLALVEGDSSSDKATLMVEEEQQQQQQQQEITTTTSTTTETETEEPVTTTTTTPAGTKPPSVTVSRDGEDDEGPKQVTPDIPGTAILVDGTLPLFGSGITDGYASQDELERALILAFRQQAQTIIEQNVRNYQHQKEWEEQHGYGGGGGGGGVGGNGFFPPPVSPDVGAGDVTESANFASSFADDAGGGAPGGAGAPDRESAGGGGGVTDFETNNQEDNVDEADMIKADRNNVYASFGDYIIIWDTDGNKVGQVKMPSIELPEKPELEGGDDIEVIAEKQGSSAAKSMWAPDYHYQPKPHINSMLLTENHLVALVSGYNNEYGHYWGNSPRTNMLYGYRACQIRLYQKEATGNLTFVGHKDVNGNFIDARSIGDVVHLATASGVDTWTHLGWPLDWYQISNGTDLTVEQYTIQATKLADAVVPKVANKLIEEIRLENGELPTLLQINQWFTQVNDTATDGDEGKPNGGPGFDLPYYQSYDVVSNVGQITSFDVNAPLTTLEGSGDKELTTKASGFMSPSYFDTLYGTQDHLVLATSGWDWNPIAQQGEQTTYVVALEIGPNDPASTTFKSVGTLRGNLLNQYALDIVDGELRAATTVERFQWWWGGRPIIPMPVEPFDMEEVPIGEGDGAVAEVAEAVAEPFEPPVETVTVGGELEELATAAVGGGVRRGRKDRLLQSRERRHLQDPEGLCPTQEEDTNCMNERNYAECITLVSEGCTSIAILESCPLQFSCFDPVTNGDTAGEGTPADIVDPDDVDTSPPLPPPPPPPVNEEDEKSRTTNYITVLKLVGEDVPAGQMSLKGQVEIGEKHERITSIRFFDNVAYAVTFERTDPFYVLDMSVPKVLGELKLPGFSSYLHSMNDDNTLLLAVGQNATETGRETGLMVTVFDATNASDPKALVSHTFENDDNAYSGSSVQWDYKAFRYVDGKLVVPLEIWYHQVWDQSQQQYLPLPPGAENFRGFAVLDVNTTSIEEQYRISHMKPDGTCFYCGGYLPQRSFVYEGDLMTVQENVVVSTGLHSGEEKWRFNIGVEGEPAECCW